MRLSELWRELKDRRVVRVAIGYAVVAAVVVQAADLTFEPLGLPAWTYTFVLVLALAGFPVALVLAWAFDVTPAGIERVGATDDGWTRPKLTRAQTVVVAVIAVGVLVAGWRVLGGPSEVGAEGVDTDLFAVVPFRVSSGDESLRSMLREGVLDILAPYLSADPRMVDPSVMISAWRNAVDSEAEDLSEGQAVELARRLGAGRVIVGSFVGTAGAFTANVRLLQVPGGDLVGDATVEGSSDELGALGTRLSGAILSLEAGEDQSRVEYLSQVPTEALEQYLAGRRLYRRTAYLESREAFQRALRIDPTFAVAAVGLYEASEMGMDQGRFDLQERAIEAMRSNLDWLPPRDRDYMRILIEGYESRVSAVERIRDLERTVRAVPDKPGAWYRLGDRLYHTQSVIGLDDPAGQAQRAFDRALELDPGLHVVRQHKLWQAIEDADTAYALAEAPFFLEAAAGSEGEPLIRFGLAFVLGHTAQQRWIRESIDTLSYWRLAGSWFPFPHGTPGSEDLERLLAALDRAAVTPEERQDVVTRRYRLLRNSGRRAEANTEWTRRERLIGPSPRRVLVDYLYWDGPVDAAERAATDIDSQVGGDPGPIAWGSGGRDLCILEISRLRTGDVSHTEQIIGRLLAGSDDPDPTHGQNALCALLLEAMLERANGGVRVDELIADLQSALDAGPPAAGRSEANLELAKLLEERGDYAAASRAAFAYTDAALAPFLYSTMVRESARLSDLAGDTDRALLMYRHFLVLFDGADPSFDEELERIRDRVAELASG